MMRHGERMATDIRYRFEHPNGLTQAVEEFEDLLRQAAETGNLDREKIHVQIRLIRTGIRIRLDQVHRDVWGRPANDEIHEAKLDNLIQLDSRIAWMAHIFEVEDIQ